MSTIHYRSFCVGVVGAGNTPAQHCVSEVGSVNRGSRRNARSCRARYARSCCVRGRKELLRAIRKEPLRTIQPAAGQRGTARRNGGGNEGYPQEQRRAAVEGPPTSRDTRGNGDGGRDSPTSERFRGSSEDAEGDQGGVAGSALGT